VEKGTFFKPAPPSLVASQHVTHYQGFQLMASASCNRLCTFPLRGVQRGSRRLIASGNVGLTNSGTIPSSSYQVPLPLQFG
jgi:hypothetical protein